MWTVELVTLGTAIATLIFVVGSTWNELRHLRQDVTKIQETLAELEAKVWEISGKLEGSWPVTGDS